MINTTLSQYSIVLFSSVVKEWEVALQLKSNVAALLERPFLSLDNRVEKTGKDVFLCFTYHW